MTLIFNQHVLENLQVDNLVAEAFSSWEAVSPLRFSKKNSETVADINIVFMRYLEDGEVYLVFEMMYPVFGMVYLGTL